MINDEQDHSDDKFEGCNSNFWECAEDEKVRKLSENTKNVHREREVLGENEKDVNYECEMCC